MKSANQSLGQPANPKCVLLFVDESGRRKWCSIQICGNRHKVQNILKKINRSMYNGIKNRFGD
ncbi:CGNR zinc finger domain-containing protein [Leuconostoc fallax]|uniref:CGNR zinc finger domain-containing protein n=1 Tax=Leuconostoc fallax TaxID=1251 RepID=UPI0010583E00